MTSYALALPGFEGRRVFLRTAGIVSRPKVLVGDAVAACCFTASEPGVGREQQKQSAGDEERRDLHRCQDDHGKSAEPPRASLAES